MSDVRRKVLTILFTDIEESTRHWEEDPVGMQRALARHDEILREAIETAGGRIVKRAGDSLLAVFEGASQAVSAAIVAQKALQQECWGTVRPLAVRMALHSGEVLEQAGDFFGPSLNRCHRLMSAAHGGQILLSVATAELVRDRLPENTTLRDLGEHRLRDLLRAESIYQVVHPDLRAEFPPIRTLSRVAHNLPVQSTTFIGREKDIEEITGLLRKTREVTLTGTGGVGKTRLALEVGAQLVKEFRDGVWFVDLGPVSDPMLVLQSIASVLSIQEQAGRELKETLFEALKTKSLLLILDNCEHLVCTCAEVVEGILTTCPNVRILATSRESLNIRGEVVWRVRSMEVPEEGVQAAEAIVGDYEAVQLFVDRARLVRPEFTLTPQNAGAVASICRLLDGIPLAIELAAARVNILSPVQIAARLSDCFRLLTSGARTVVSRHKTLQAAIEWSYDLLSIEEKLLFERLSVFAGGFDLEAVEKVCSGDGIEREAILDLLSLLVEKSLVVPGNGIGAGGEVDSSGSPMRYRLLTTLSFFGYQKLVQRKEEVTMRRKHLDYYLTLAEALEPELYGPRQAEALERLSAEHHNLLAALRWVQETGQELEKGLRLACALYRSWEIRGVLADSLRLLRGIMNRIKETGEEVDPALLAKANTAAGSILWMMGDFEAARECHLEALNLRKAIGDLAGVASSLNNLAIIACAKQDYAGAIPLLQEAYATLQAVGDERRLAGCLINLAGVYIDSGNFAAARGSLQDALSIVEKTGDLMGKALALSNLTAICLKERNLRGALGYALQSLEISVRLKGTRGTLEVLEDLVQIYYEVGLLNESVRLVSIFHTLSKSYEGRLQRAPLVVERLREALKRALGPEIFQREWNEGAKMSLDEVLELARRPIPESVWNKISTGAASQLESKDQTEEGGIQYE